MYFVRQHMYSQSPPLSPTSARKRDSSEAPKESGSPSAATTTDQSEEREQTPPPQTADEEWVEYVDSFGRTRSCLRKDLPEFVRIDQQLEAKKAERKSKRNRCVHVYKNLANHRSYNVHFSGILSRFTINSAT